MLKRSLWLIALQSAIIVLAGCAPKAVPHNVAFDERELLPYASAAKASLVGQAFRKTAGGDVKFAAGELVELIPATRYVQEWWEVEFIGGRPLVESAEARAKLDAHSHATRADGNGNFEFAQVPAGDYYVITNVSWFVPSYGQQGGKFGQKVTVRAGQQTKVILTL